MSGIKEYNPECVAGDTLEFAVTIKSGGSVVDLTSATITGKLATAYGGTAIDAITITNSNPTSGRFIVSIDCSDAGFTTTPGNYPFDVSVTPSGGAKRTRVRGVLRLLPEVDDS